VTFDGGGGGDNQTTGIFPRTGHGHSPLQAVLLI
jgi:hypothetical protein